jgi:hypothetical protein
MIPVHPCSKSLGSIDATVKTTILMGRVQLAFSDLHLFFMLFDQFSLASTDHLFLPLALLHIIYFPSAAFPT